MAHPGMIQQHELALSAYDNDLVNIARARFPGMSEQLDWLQKAQHQRDVDNINRTKALIYPVR
jgi:hypothetical protein